MKKMSVFIFLACLGFCTNACGATFTGKVIDADTKEPIEGAVVVASWLEETATVAGPSTRLKDIKETLTDRNGEWAIRGPKGKIGGSITALFTFFASTYYTKPPEFIVFKPGYCPYPEGFGIAACKEKLRPYGIGNREITQLPKLTNREDRLKVVMDPRHADGNISEEEVITKQLHFIRLINEERKQLGLSLY